ncbi:MAG: outer membrane protein assembly factor BamE [Alphaproteobacteria bacterium]|nr:outer membrane protein assembly factor BamE [Alphaproteobacteria bacterium]MBU0806174.1 outer membrane protein assembly factor BamE [Alphaproteobacteria bacterium]MBU0874255.1 outer membrane protein assembly factor BamE [Alphaproteobacteria bacterium]MBU1400482.1 outer membrane protein assembly factor BamE [Alphaproteobacteria bacterium]MBU1592906.1 outer membrane protein assembly factor BamE [Alphaproteobacteria bacterium]
MELLLAALKFKTPSLQQSTGAVSLLVAAIALSGCNTSKTFSGLTPGETLTQGYVVDQESIDLVPIGSSREQVLLALGTPSTTATFDNEVFYYVSQTRRRPVAFMNAKVIDQRILAVYFNSEGRVENIANYGLKDGKVFDFISRTTPTGGKDQNFLGQMISGIGNIGQNTAKNVFGGGN